MAYSTHTCTHTCALTCTRTHTHTHSHSRAHALLWPRPHCRAEVRNSALEVLFDTLKLHGSSFAASFWKRVFDSVLLPIFDHVRAEVGGGCKLQAVHKGPKPPPLQVVPTPSCRHLLECSPHLHALTSHPTPPRSRTPPHSRARRGGSRRTPGCTRPALAACSTLWTCLCWWVRAGRGRGFVRGSGHVRLCRWAPARTGRVVA